MKFILIGTLLGSLITSEHDNRETCEGRSVLLREKGAIVKCTERPGSGAGATSGTWQITPHPIPLTQNN